MYAREARVQGLKSRAAFKLLEMDAKYRLFRPGQTVVDLGYAPGSWSQVAVERTKPSGKVVGIDLLPAQPPRGVSAIQGNFLSADVQAMVKHLLLRVHRQQQVAKVEEQKVEEKKAEGEEVSGVVVARPSYIDMEKAAVSDGGSTPPQNGPERPASEQLVDVILSDMMMNTSGNAFRDHAGSIDLCTAALHFASDTLKCGGHFVCKFYQGAEDKILEQQLKQMFAKVYREKPDSSRSESREAYFVGLRKRPP